MEKGIHAMRDLANEERDLSFDVSDPELYEWSRRLDTVLQDAAKTLLTHPETQSEIFEIQQKKRDIFVELKEQLACLDRPECHLAAGEDDRPAKDDAEQNARVSHNDIR